MKGLQPDELCEVCKNAKGQQCLTESQSGLNMKCVSQIVETRLDRGLNEKEKIALCLFLSTLSEHQIVFALEARVVLPKEVLDRLIYSMRQGKNGIKLSEQNFQILFDIARKKNLKSAFRQQEPTRTIVQLMKDILGIKNNQYIIRDGFLIEQWKELAEYKELNPVQIEMNELQEIHYFSFQGDPSVFEKFKEEVAQKFDIKLL